MIFTNIWDLLNDMRSHGSKNIICADGVDGVLGYGWVCQDTEKVWAISFSDFIKTVSQHEEHLEVLTQYFSSAENRRNIRDLLDKLLVKE